MASYTGGARESARILALEETRAARTRELARQKGAIAAAASSASGLSREFTTTSDAVEDLLASDTVGLVTHEDFKARRLYLERCAAEVREKRNAKLRGEQAAERQLKLRKGNSAKLSFADGDESEDSDGDGSSSSEDKDTNRTVKRPLAEMSKEGWKSEPAVEEGEEGNKRACGRDIKRAESESEAKRFEKRPRVTKNPDANTDFLPDRDRELAEEEERERLKQEWHNEQECRKNELVNITYSYWDGSGHRRTIRCKKGTTVGRFLSMVQAEFKELRNVSSDELVFVKEDLIIPHHYSFYDFIVSKARGKSGPLFNFDVVEDVRLVSDAKKEKEDAHAAKVVERRWYERNRHIFPASRWVTFDPKARYGAYTIHGS
jgi:protein FAM50